MCVCVVGGEGLDRVWSDWLCSQGMVVSTELAEDIHDIHKGNVPFFKKAIKVQRPALPIPRQLHPSVNIS
jgi:hypothetical protein